MKSFAFCTLACLLVAEISLGTTIRVPSQEATIQAGIEAASEDDTVLVAPGTYTGNGNRDLGFGGKNIVLKSEAGPELTIIDSEGMGRGFHFNNGEDSTAVVEGFTITGSDNCCDCFAPPPWCPPCDSRGGGILCESSSPTVYRNIISENNANRGGGIYLFDSRAHVIENTISNNSACCSFGGEGGGIYASSSQPSIIGNLIINNTTCAGDMGISTGAGICMKESAGLLLGNSVIGNLSVSQLGSLLIGGLVLYESAPAVDRCLFAYNGGTASWATPGYPVPRISCCLSFGHEWSDSLPGVDFETDILGNLNLDPLICDTAALDYRIDVGSPCAPPNNQCGQLIGALGIGCWEFPVQPIPTISTCGAVVFSVLLLLSILWYVRRRYAHVT